MAFGNFDDFVNREIVAARRPDGPKTDWQREEEEWLRRLDDLYLRLDTFLRPYIDAGQISISIHPIEINEEHLGSYMVPQMTINIGNKSVLLEPMGTVQVGSRGRVDVVCNRARKMMILVESGTEAQLLPSSGIGRPQISKKSLTEGRWIWRIVTHETVDLTRDSFQALLVDVAKG